MSKTLAELLTDLCREYGAIGLPGETEAWSVGVNWAADWLTAQGVWMVPREVTDKMWQDAVCTYQTLIGDDPHFVHAGHMKKAVEAALTAHDTGGPTP